MRRTGSKRVNESPKLSLSLASALGRGRGPRGSTQQSFYKQCNKRDKPVLEDIDGDDFEFDAHTNNQEHEHEHEHGHSDGEVSINDDVSFHFDEIVNSNGGAGHDIIFGNENPSLSESAPSDTRRISVLGSKNMELAPVNTNSCMEVSFSECSKDSSIATSLSSSIGIKNTNHQIVRRLAGRYDNVLALISCHNNNLLGGQLLISSGADGTIVVWHSVLHTVVYYLIEHLKPVHALLVVPKDDTPGNHLVSGCNGGKIVVWDLDTGLLLRKIGFMDEESESDGVTCLALRKHPQCKRVLVVAGYMGGSIHIWDFEKNILIFSLQGHSNVVCALSVLEKNSQRVEREDDFFIVSSSQDSTIQVYDMQDQETETVVDKLKDFAQTKMTHMLSKKNKPSSKPKIMKSFYHMSTEESERSLDDEALSLHKPMKVFKGHEGSVRKFIMRPKQSCRNFGNYIISCGDDCTVRYWDVESETEVRILRGHSHKVSDICAREVEVNDSILNSPAIHQNYILVTASLDRTVVIWDGISGEALRCLLGHSEEVYSLCLVDKDVCKFDVVSAGSGGEVIMWNIDCQQDVCTMTLKDRTGSTPMGDYRTRAVSLNEFKKNFHDRSLICIRNCAITQQECEDEEISEPDSGDGESVKDSSSYTYISCHYGSNVITIYEGFAKRTMRASREFKITYPRSDNKDAEFDNNDDGDTLRITALSWLDIVDQKGKSNASYFILAGQSNGDINVMDCVNGSLVKVLSERTDEDHNDDRFAKNTAIVAICTRKLTQTEKSDIARHHIIAARRNGTIVIWDFESEDVCCHFRDHDEDILCLATLEVNFTLLDSLSDGGVRFTSLSSLQSTYDFGIVTGASSGMIKFWKFNVFGGGWMQCYEISTAMEDINHGGCGISSISILENDLIPLGQESAVRNLSNFQLVTGYLNGAINLWDIHSKSISMVIDEKKDIDMTLYKGGSDYAVVDVCVGKTTDGFDITCGRNNRDVVQWKNIDINNVPGNVNVVIICFTIYSIHIFNVRLWDFTRVCEKKILVFIAHFIQALWVDAL
jgi:WD40 repeat protein